MFKSKKQKAVYTYIADYIKANDMAPIYQEIADHFNNSLSTIHGHVMSLEEGGLIMIDPDKSRSITLLSKFCPNCGADMETKEDE